MPEKYLRANQWLRMKSPDQNRRCLSHSAGSAEPGVEEGAAARPHRSRTVSQQDRKSLHPGDENQCESKHRARKH